MSGQRQEHTTAHKQTSHYVCNEDSGAENECLIHETVKFVERYSEDWIKGHTQGHNECSKASLDDGKSLMDALKQT